MFENLPYFGDDDDEDADGRFKDSIETYNDIDTDLDALKDLEDLSYTDDALKGYGFNGVIEDKDDRPLNTGFSGFEEEEWEYEEETIDTIEPVSGGLDETPSGAGLPERTTPTTEDRREEFEDEYADEIAYHLTRERLREEASDLVDADPEVVEAVVMDAMETEDLLSQPLYDTVLEQAEETYINDPTYYNGRHERLADKAIEETLKETLPTHRLRDDVTKVYDGTELDPRAIQRHLVRQMAQDVDAAVSEYDASSMALVSGQRLTADQSPEEAVDGLPHSIERMESRPGETVMGVRWDTEHPSVQRAAADAFQESIGKDIQRAATGATETPQEELEDLQDRYETAIERFRVDATLQEMEKHWRTADMPYEVFEIDDHQEMEQAAKDIGNCRTNATSYYEDLAEDPHTTILGVRRDDTDEWIGVARAFHMETDEGEDVFAIDNLGMQYKEGQEAGAPSSSCNFEEFGDALPVMGLASIAYGLEQDFDYVVAGRKDSRVGGGPGDRIGVAQLYSTKNTDQGELPVEKKGERDIERPFGLTELTSDIHDQQFALLMENPSAGS